MIISQQGEACSPNEDIKALDLNGTKALRDRLLQIASTGGGEEALLAGAEMELGADQEKLGKIEEARHALQDFRDYILRFAGVFHPSLPSEEELKYSYNPETKECEITRLDGQDIKLNLNLCFLKGELPLPPQLMVTQLYCAHNQLTALPVLPSSLTELSCSENKLTTLPELPASLTDLNCWRNQLTALPELPARLTELSCSGNQITSLPELPASLTVMYCAYNDLTALPELPASLTALYCDRNKLTTLPELPAKLTELYCSENQLTALPELPDSLNELDCRDNPSLARKRATKRILKTFSDRGGVVVS